MSHIALINRVTKAQKGYQTALKTIRKDHPTAADAIESYVKALKESHEYQVTRLQQLLEPMRQANLPYHGNPNTNGDRS